MKSATYQGKLIKWKDDRGFGFIKPDGEDKEIFLHISALTGASRRPQVGDTIFYEKAVGKDGKLSAAKASIQGVSSRNISKGQYKSVPKSSKSSKSSKGTLQILSSVFGIVVFGFLVISANRNLFTNCKIKGNISVSSGDKLYHLPEMPEYEITQIDIAKGEKYFCSESEAIASGWRKAPR
ncbi:MAG: hypothetical protein AUK48_15850 [Oscillatoriales cyanobacterium CG2_30_44_21]|nr:MAG: hypothetical protein AUK48_15850 [Oscillatoriales cyanobacterium CG2_30_44_21]